MDIIQEMQELKLEGMIPSCPRDFPPEIVHEILIRLPATSLVKCTSVCKTWRSMIINRSFFSVHLTRRGNLAGQNGTRLLLLHRVCGKKRTILFKTGCHVTDEVHSLHFDNQAFDEVHFFV
ncbi:F-box/kelch-repeat protein [Pyrus ussuriensis x Pyrus communis]|uniref:F-box/kelch-repeat protein n=1 Tax=Pyrus ussuriensis x Pyrus communis TaxID=2448454 RepID=A0A5N5H3I1_9ROSA|nr:F-box/kelch-repeat protein [Pyrus ussuriensis x Pyrus communis]